MANEAQKKVTQTGGVQGKVIQGLNPETATLKDIQQALEIIFEDTHSPHKTPFFQFSKEPGIEAGRINLEVAFEKTFPHKMENNQDIPCNKHYAQMEAQMQALLERLAAGTRMGPLKHTEETRRNSTAWKDITPDYEQIYTMKATIWADQKKAFTKMLAEYANDMAELEQEHYISYGGKNRDLLNRFEEIQNGNAVGK